MACFSHFTGSSNLTLLRGFMFVRFLQLVHLSGIIRVRAAPKGQSKGGAFLFLWLL